jgi:Arc/MetJ-type ribon-helix-helix transcriptional regulator
VRNYRTVSLPIGLVTSIEAYVADRGVCQGYVSLSDFVKDACRRRLDEMQESGVPASCGYVPITGEIKDSHINEVQGAHV